MRILKYMSVYANRYYFTINLNNQYKWMLISNVQFIFKLENV